MCRVSIPSQLASFTRRCAALSQKAVGNEDIPTDKKDDGGYEDWVIVAIHGLREYLSHLSRRLLDVLWPGNRFKTFGLGRERTSGWRDYAASMGKIEGSPLDSDDIWAVVILAAVNQTSIWEVCDETDETPCDDVVMDWLHTLDRGWLEFTANLLFRRLAMTILDPSRSRIVSIDFVDNPYHGTHYEDDGELCRMGAKDGTTTCHRYCTAYVVSNGKTVTLAMTYVRSDEQEADAVEDGVISATSGCSGGMSLSSRRQNSRGDSTEEMSR